MMETIKKLSDDLINKIAAGEVVERPASVVKELVENALDAGATKIKINIRDGGKKLIQVIDDGNGISENQLELAIQRHTSSKIQNFDDIYTLKTKGFRGEALASICSVAKVSLCSKTEEGDSKEIYLEDGGRVVLRDCAHPKGTTVTVKYLFHNTPARLKFLKKTETETAHIIGIVTKISLCHSHVAFSVYQNERILFDVQKQNFQQRVISILGNDFSDHMYPFQAEMQGMALSGYFGHPQISRSQRNFTYFFVNQRPVNDKVIWHAVMESYRDLLMRGKYPVLVLTLHIDEKLIDVNVHPAKSEIRFHQSQQVHHFIQKTLRDHLQQKPWISSPLLTEPVQYDTEAENEIKQSNISYVRANPQKEQNSIAIEESQKNIHFGRTLYAQMQPIGQLWGTYILCEVTDKLFIIDQHAAHERIGYEKLMKQHKEKGILSQPLLIPDAFELKPSDGEIFKNYLEELKNYGFEIEYFGGTTFVIKAVPGVLEGKLNIKKFVHDLVADILETGELLSLKDRYHDILATIACHAQIRANHHLELAEMQALLKELDEYQFTDFCPHGRPVCIEVTKEELEKWFKRIVS